jgi:O-antigen ligase
MLSLWPFIEHFVLIDLGSGYPDVNVLRTVIFLLLMAIFVKVISNSIKLQFDIFLKLFVFFSSYIIFDSLIQYKGSIHQLQHLLDIYIFPSIVYFVLLNLKNHEYENFKKNAVVSVLAGGLLVSILGIAETVYGNNIFGTTPGKCLVEWGYYRSSGPFNDGITYAAVLLFFLPISWYAYDAKVISKRLYITVFTLTSVASVLHLSRACWIVFLAVFLILFGKNKKIVTTISLFILGIGLYLYINPFVVQEVKSSDVFMNRFSDATTMITRYELYISLLDRFLENPFAGIGFTNLSIELLPHNSYLQMLVELGIFGFGLWIFFIFSGLCATYKQFNRNTEKNNDSVQIKKVLMCFLVIMFIVPNTIAAFNGYAMMFQYVISIASIQYIMEIQADSACCEK